MSGLNIFYSHINNRLCTGISKIIVYLKNLPILYYWKPY